jgi:hypothetical protein
MSGFVACDLSGFIVSQGVTEYETTEWLQEIRTMRFEEAYENWQAE